MASGTTASLHSSGSLWALACVWAVGLITVFSVIDRALPRLPFISLDRVIWLVLMALLAFRWLNWPASRPRLGRLELAMAVYLAVILLAWLPTVPHKALSALRQDAWLLTEGVVIPFSALLLARSLDWPRDRLVACLWALAVGAGGFLAGLGILQYAFSWRLFQPLPSASSGDHVNRVAGTYGNAIAFGIVVALLLLLVLALYPHTLKPALKWVLLLVAGGLMLVLVFNASLAVWLATPIALAFALTRRPALLRPLLGAVLAAALLAVPAVLLSHRSPAVRAGGAEESLLTPADRLGDSTSLESHFAANAIALNMALHRPIFGFGFGSTTFAEHKETYHPTWPNIPREWAAWPRVPHNEMLHMLVMAGLFGLAAYLALLWTTWRSLTWARASVPSESLRADLALFVQAAFVVVVVNALFLDTMYLSQVLVLFYFLLGIVLHAPTPVAEV